jgi:hypothetical protein
LAVAHAPAEEPSHWAYQPLQKSPVPLSAGENSLSPIDAFVLARLQASGRKFNPPADRATLLRRVTFDLTGLPPTLAEQQAFAADTSPDAFERLVDRLLASPRHGERLAADWLDLAHYADTHGYHADAAREMWRWRDWVIYAFNRGMPFDQFTREQVAGDLLPNATLEERLATGFFRNHMINSENGAIDDEYRAEYVADRVSTLGTVWLGQTLSCARCHDHKYDPISQAEFYQLAAFFNQLPENGVAGRTGNATPTMTAPTRLQRQELTQLDARLKPLEIALAERSRTVGNDVAKWETARRVDADTRTPPEDAIVRYAFEEKDVASPHVANSGRFAGIAEIKGPAERVDFKSRQSLLCDGTTNVEQTVRATFDAKQPWTASLWIFPTTSDRMSLASVADELQSQRGWEVGLADERLFARISHAAGSDEIFVRSKEPLKQRVWQQITAVYDGSGKAAGLRLILNGKAIEQEFVRDKLIGHPTSDQPFRVGRLGESFGFHGILDEVQLFLRPLSTTEIETLAGNDPIGDLLRVPTKNRTAEQQQAVVTYYLTQVDPVAKKLREQIEPLKKQRERIQGSLSTVMILQDGEKFRPTFILERGLYDEPRAEVQPGWPLKIVPVGRTPKLKSGRLSRLDLANWLITDTAPLTSRVAANRAWQLAWGRGLVATPEDFGTRGTLPTHPELLDWLASDFIASGWEQKRLLRQIITSQAYRQSSRPASTQQLEFDPHNELCARGPRGRLLAEMIRDAALLQGGLIVERLGGPSVVPLQPGDLWRELAYNTEELSAQSYRPGHGADLVRRSVYSFWKRSAPPASLCLLDAPDRETTIAERGQSNTPMQALLLLNDVTFEQAAESIARQVLARDLKTPDDRCRLLFQLILCRPATDDECRRFTRLYDASLAEQHSPLAAWTTVAMTLLNLDEAITKR